MVTKLGNSFFDMDKNINNNFLDMKEVIVPYAWHSFCISIDFEENIIKLYHNDHIQLIQHFTITHDDKEGVLNLMRQGHLAGPKFVGFITDFQIFGKSLLDDEIYEWAMCDIKVTLHRLEFKKKIFFRKLGTCFLLWNNLTI